MFDLKAVMIFLMVMAVKVTSAHDWRSNYSPNVIQKYSDLVDRRIPIPTGVLGEDFKLLWINGSIIYLGVKNEVILLNTDGKFVYRTYLTWMPEASRHPCGGYVVFCDNYIWLMQPIDEGRAFFTCGTNANNPRCGFYNITTGVFDKYLKEDVTKHMQKNPRENTTEIVAGGKLIATTASQRSRAVFIADLHHSFLVSTMRNTFHEVEFVASFERDNEVFLFYRGHDHMTQANCGQVFPQLTTSGVARFCKNDRGTHLLAQNVQFFRTFYKAALDCSIPDIIPFQFNELQAIAEVSSGYFVGTEGIKPQPDPQVLIYGVFNTPENGPGGSAVCVYSHKDLEHVFNGKVKFDGKVSRKCDDNSSEINKGHIENPMMKETVKPIGGKPIFYFTDSKSKLTQIAIDPSVVVREGHICDVIFLGTDDGRVIKVINKRGGPMVIEDLQVLSPGEAVTKLQLFGHGRGKMIMVMSRQQLIFLPVQRCESSFAIFLRKRNCDSIDSYCKDYIHQCVQNRTRK